jgi:hypothetical protein
VENLTFCISIKYGLVPFYLLFFNPSELIVTLIPFSHNWSNEYNVETMYNVQVEATKRVENALDDVRDLLRDRVGQGWEKQWRDVVEDVLEKDAGWK